MRLKTTDTPTIAPRLWSRFKPGCFFGRFQAMGNLVVIGAQWGDEGKGKIVDIWPVNVDAVVRYREGPRGTHGDQ